MDHWLDAECGRWPRSLLGVVRWPFQLSQIGWNFDQSSDTRERDNGSGEMIMIPTALVNQRVGDRLAVVVQSEGCFKGIVR